MFDNPLLTTNTKSNVMQDIERLQSLGAHTALRDRHTSRTQLAEPTTDAEFADLSNAVSVHFIFKIPIMTLANRATRER